MTHQGSGITCFPRVAALVDALDCAGPWLELALACGIVGIALMAPAWDRLSPPASLDAQVGRRERPRGRRARRRNRSGPTAARVPISPDAPRVVPVPAGQVVGDDYRIGPQDLIEIQVFGIDNLKREVRVNSRGIISLPLVGPVTVAGLTNQEAETLIAAKYEKDYLQDPQVSVFIKEFTSQRITRRGRGQSSRASSRSAGRRRCCRRSRLPADRASCRT